jgi:hypothetical protein
VRVALSAKDGNGLEPLGGWGWGVSWDVSLELAGESVDVDNHAEGAIYVLGGTTRAELSITYNYFDLFAAGGLNFRSLDGKTGEQSAPLLADALTVIEALPGEESGNYWKATPGNAARPLRTMLAWALTHPSATWRIT